LRRRLTRVLGCQCARQVQYQSTIALPYFLAIAPIDPAVTADTEPLASEAYVLVRSLRDHYPDSPVVCFVPDGSLDRMDEAVRRYLRDATDVVEGPFPVPDYPPSALLAALRAAPERHPTADYYVAVDTDAAVINPLTLPEADVDCFLTPNVWSETGVWSAVDGPREPWLALFDRFDVDPPEDRVRAAVDGVLMWPPYYNSGVVVTGDPAFPERWIDVTRVVLEGDEVDGRPLLADQIALSVVAAERDVAHLDALRNYLMPAFLRVPDDVQVLHYHHEDVLATLRNPVVKRRLASYGVRFDPRPTDWLLRPLSWSVYRATNVVHWRTRRRYWSLLQPLFDWNDPNA